MATERRQLLRLGALFLFIATLLGVILAAGAANPVLWRATHVTTILVGLTLIGQGLVWTELRLSDRQRRAAFIMARVGAGSILILGILTAILNIPGPATAPGVAPQGIQIVVLIAVLLTTVPTAIGSTFLVWRGLGGD
jgi:hypothetical protein